MTNRTMRVALIVSWLATAVSIALVVHLRARNGEQAERIRQLEAINNLRGIAESVRIYQEQSFDVPPKFDPDRQL